MTRNPRIYATIVSALLFSATATGCDLLGLSGPSGPGELHANVVSPNALDGAAVLEITGGLGLGSIASDDGEVFYQHDGGTTRLVVVLDNPGLITFRVRVDDVAELPSATVTQVSDGNNELRSSLSGYEIEWVQLADSDLELHRGTP
ncbi:hypothetical protein ACFL3B_02460 [Gemmatimonadota bacterium]